MSDPSDVIKVAFDSLAYIKSLWCIRYTCRMCL